MLVFAIRRLLQAIPILLGVSLVVFGLVHIVPGNPIDMLMPPEASPEVIAQMKAAFGFDKPLYIQYLLWLLRALHGDFGAVGVQRQPVWGQLITALGNTFILAIFGACWAFRLGIACGMIAALHHGRWPDKVFSAIATTGVSLPHYWCAIVLVMFCAVLHDWLPAQGMGDDSLPLYDRLQYLVLPVITLSLIPMGVIGRLVRATVLEILGQDFVGALTAKGLTRWPVIRHICKNAAPPVLALMGLAVRLSARRLDPGGDGVQLARLRQPAQPGDLPPRYPRAAGDDPGAGQRSSSCSTCWSISRRRRSIRACAAEPEVRMSHTTIDVLHAGTAERRRCCRLRRRPAIGNRCGQRLARDPVTIAVTPGAAGNRVHFARRAAGLALTIPMPATCWRG